LFHVVEYNSSKLSRDYNAMQAWGCCFPLPLLLLLLLLLAGSLDCSAHGLDSTSGAAHGGSKAHEGGQDDDGAGLVHRSKRERDEVQEGGDAKSDLSEGGGGDPGRPALRDAGEGVGAKTKDGAASNEVLGNKGGEGSDGLIVSCKQVI
jgi:hypothetical protein